MNGSQMLDIMGLIDPAFIEEAETASACAELARVSVFKKRPWVKWAAAAAAVLIVAAGAPGAIYMMRNFGSGGFVDPNGSGTPGIVSPADGGSSAPSGEGEAQGGNDAESGSKPKAPNSSVAHGNESNSAAPGGNHPANDPVEHNQTEAPKPDDAVSGTVFVGLDKVYRGNPTELFPYIEIESIEDVYLSAITSSGKTLDDVDEIVREMVGTTFEITLAEKTEHAVDKAITLLTKDARVKYAGQEFIGEDISSYHMEFDIDGYCCGKLAENVTVKNNTWSFAFDGYKAHIEADGETVEGILKSGVDYDLVIEMKVIPCYNG